MMTGRIRQGKPIWAEHVRAWLNDTLAIQPRYAGDTLTVLKKGGKRYTGDTAAIPSCVRPKGISVIEQGETGEELTSFVSSPAPIESASGGDVTDPLTAIVPPDLTPLVAVAPSPQAAKPQRKKPEPSERDVAAWQLLDAASKLIRQYVPVVLTVADWKKHNKRAALELLDGGKTQAEILAMLAVRYEVAAAKKYYGLRAGLDRLAEEWPRLEQFAAENSPIVDDDGFEFVQPDPYEHGGRADLYAGWSPERLAEHSAKALADRPVWLAERIARDHAARAAGRAC
jgi:hypothetical protein